MNALYPTDLSSYLNVMMIFFRLMGFLVLLPGLSHKSVPNQFKVLFCLTLSLSLYPLIKPNLILFDESFSGFVGAAIRESSVGLLMGFMAYITFESISLAAQMLGYQMGLGTAALLDPVNQANVSLIVPLHTWIALALFFIGNFHHEALAIFAKSYILTKHTSIELVGNKPLLDLIVHTTSKLFVMAVTLSAPLTAVILLTNLMIGVLSRLIPQMNVILFSFPITIMLSLAGIYILAPELIEFLSHVLEQMGVDVTTALRTL